MSENQEPKRKRGRPLSEELFVLPPDMAKSLMNIGFFNKSLSRFVLWPSLPIADKIDRIYRFRAAMQRAMTKYEIESIEIALSRSWKQIGRYLRGDDAPMAVLEATALIADLPIDWVLTGSTSSAENHVMSVAMDDALQRSDKDQLSEKSFRSSRDASPLHEAIQAYDIADKIEQRNNHAAAGENFGVEIDADAFSERLRSAVRDAGGNQAVSVKSGVPLGTLNNYMRGVSEPKATALAQIAYACGVSLDWLMIGSGAAPAPLPVPVTPAAHVEIARFSARASAGYGERVFDEPPASFWQVPREMLRGFSGNTKHLASTDISGDSMYPTLQDGEPVIFDRSSRQVDREGVYVLTVGDDLFVKRVRRVPQGDGTIALELISDNPAYEKITLAPDAQDHVRIHGHVIWPSTSRRL